MAVEEVSMDDLDPGDEIEIVYQGTVKEVLPNGIAFTSNSYHCRPTQDVTFRRLRRALPPEPPVWAVAVETKQPYRAWQHAYSGWWKVGVEHQIRPHTWAEVHARGVETVWQPVLSHVD